MQATERLRNVVRERDREALDARETVDGLRADADKVRGAFAEADFTPRSPFFSWRLFEVAGELSTLSDVVLPLADLCSGPRTSASSSRPRPGCWPSSTSRARPRRTSSSRRSRTSASRRRSTGSGPISTSSGSPPPPLLPGAGEPRPRAARPWACRGGRAGSASRRARSAGVWRRSGRTGGRPRGEWGDRRRRRRRQRRRG
jgi:hypothetical protein